MEEGGEDAWIGKVGSYSGWLIFLSLLARSRLMRYDLCF